MVKVRNVSQIISAMKYSGICGFPNDAALRPFEQGVMGRRFIIWLIG